jgi:CspA family cold shock protein
MHQASTLHDFVAAARLERAEVIERRPVVAGRRWVMPEIGTVKWFNNDKGYGFIKRETGEDVFVHHTAIQAQGYRTLNEGEQVEFEVKQGPKGLQAENVHRPEGASGEQRAG